MTRRRSILLISNNPDVDRILDIIASTYGFSILTANNVKQGLRTLHTEQPDCVILDLSAVDSASARPKVKKIFQEQGLPILFINDLKNGGIPKSDIVATVRIEPIARFVANRDHELKAMARRGPLGRFVARWKSRTAKQQALL